MCTIILTNDESYRYMMYQIDQMLLQMYCASLKNYACHEKVAYYKKYLAGKGVIFLTAYIDKPLSNW